MANAPKSLTPLGFWHARRKKPKNHWVFICAKAIWKSLVFYMREQKPICARAKPTHHSGRPPIAFSGFLILAEAVWTFSSNALVYGSKNYASGRHCPANLAFDMREICAKRDSERGGVLRILAPYYRRLHSKEIVNFLTTGSSAVRKSSISLLQEATQ